MSGYRACSILLFLVLQAFASGVQAQDSPFPSDADLTGLQQGEFRLKTDSTDSGRMIDYGIIVP